MTTTWQDRYSGAVMNTFGVPKLMLERGAGAHVWDADGNEYLDMLAGIAVNSLGHAHPALVQAVSTQLATLGHVSNLFATEPQLRLAERLVEMVGGDARVFLSNSGTEANEAALKVTRRTGRTKIVATEDAFHGRTMGALALTATEAYRAPFEPLPGDVVWVPFGDAEALAAAVDEQTAAVIVEPLQGEAGVNVPPRDYLLAVREITSRHGALMWIDEIQTGIGRTGTLLAHRNPELFDGEVVPDLVTLAKGLGGGVPIGATVALGATASLLVPGNHGTTFGGNPIATAAANAVLDTIEDDDLLTHVEGVGEILRKGLEADPRVTEIRGAGLMLGLTLADSVDTATLVDAALAAGLIINVPRVGRVRLVPPLVLTVDDAERFLTAFATALDAAGVSP
ncbi:acetylornithine transaminase [Nocardioides jishulii]|uniref:Acetylornithine aminotransferase n=1 Tax=Nocardioides jishulii TaxID=2575440 RepID=A0A4U2YML8_9ACTN|nr:acetylornithine transaminase [Nocardioides jishulii]QCX27335.1 acetylornithine transaminase [Nocardioides jishulii]TKI61822.1 acetylornithine transaminase [Nocardioides jishulii]